MVKCLPFWTAQAQVVEHTNMLQGRQNINRQDGVRMGRVPAHGMNFPDDWVIPSIFITVRPMLHEMKCKAQSVTAASTHICQNECSIIKPTRALLLDQTAVREFVFSCASDLSGPLRK